MLIGNIRLVVVLLCLNFIVSNILAQDTLSQAELKTVLRSVAHQTLLQAGDSTSRVLPLEKVNDAYIISFESDSIMKLFSREAKRKGFPQHFVVEAIACESDFVVHSFVINQEDQSNILACKQRNLPEDCYQLRVSILEKEIELKEMSTATKGETSYLLLLVLIVLSGVLILFNWWFNQRKVKRIKQNSHLIRIGQIQFDSLNTELLIDDQRFELTAKEGELLMLLYEKVNKTIERDVILNRVWGDEGDYVGRTLDVFISKLRKKLEADSKVKIVNIRGVGYKMVVNQ